MKIDDYSFGRMEIGGNTYTRDLIILPDEIKSNWWRKEGHSLSLEDLPGVVSRAPLTLIVGTGAYGVMKVPELLKAELKKLGIALYDFPTEKAVLEYNQREGQEKVVGAFHLTC